VAIALSIIGIIGSFGFGTLSQIIAMQKEKETEKHLEQIMYALAGFALRHNRLPAAGIQDKGEEVQGQLEGTVPYKTLGIPIKIAKDGHNKMIHYSVNGYLTQTTSIRGAESSPQTSFCYCSPSLFQLTVKDESGQSVLKNNYDDFIAVVLTSHKNNSPQGQNPSQSQNNRRLWASRNSFLSLYGGYQCKKDLNQEANQN